MKLWFSGPSLFAPVLREILKYTKAEYEKNYLNYSIYVILTDDISHDMQDTIDCIVEGSFLPLSIIILGIGIYNFDKMGILKGGKKGLTDSKGTVWMRDIVKFVKFDDFKDDPFMLYEQVLE